jgi:hypothetical protein
LSTISLPSGAMATAASLKFPKPERDPDDGQAKNQAKEQVRDCNSYSGEQEPEHVPDHGRGTCARSPDHSPAERPQDVGGEAERGDAEGDRDDEDAHDQPHGRKCQAVSKLSRSGHTLLSSASESPSGGVEGVSARSRSLRVQELAASFPIYGLAIGSRTSKQDPSARAEVTTPTWPRWTSTIRRTIASPRPDPGTLRSVEPR